MAFNIECASESFGMLVKLQTGSTPDPLNQNIWKVDPRSLHFNKLPGVLMWVFSFGNVERKNGVQ